MALYGVDLSVDSGIGSGLSGILMSEVGAGHQMKAAFRSAEAFAWWRAACPENRITKEAGGQVAACFQSS